MAQLIAERSMPVLAQRADFMLGAALWVSLCLCGQVPWGCLSFTHRCVSSVFPRGGVPLLLRVSWRGERAFRGLFSRGLSMAFVYGDG